MNDDQTDDPGVEGSFGNVPSEWAPPASSLPAPPPAPAAATAPSGSGLEPPAAPVAESVSTGPVLADAPRRGGIIGRGVALVAAAVLVGGGGYLAINAGADDGGAGSPEAALADMLDALADEDLIGAAEFVEPSERDTMVDAGFEVVEELIRLEVFDDSLDLSSVDGFDVEFDDVVIDAVEVQSGLAHLFIQSGTATTAVDGAEFPLGALVTDRVDAEDLAVEESATESMRSTDTPIVAVERNGRWYLSLWYTVAENALLETGATRPVDSARLPEIGADSPERAIENFVAALERLDLATMIGMLDPQEASALYDYAPVFIDDAQAGADDFQRAIRGEGWTWEVTDLELRSEGDGSLATVFIDHFGFMASGPQGQLEASFRSELIEVVFEGDGLMVDYLVEGDCFTVTVDEGYGPDTMSMCNDELLDDAGLGSLNSTALGGITTVDEFGIVVRNVGGRWYISPIRTGTQLMLQSIRALDADMLADTVDAFIDLVRDPFSVGATDFDFGSESSFDPPSLVPAPEPTVDFEPEPSTQDNIDLIGPGLEVAYAYDLTGSQRDDLWWLWLDEVERLQFGDGVVAQVWLSDGSFVDLVVVEGLTFASDEDFAAWLGGEVVVDNGFTYVTASNTWGDSMLLARSADGFALVNMYGGFSPAGVTALADQVGG